MVTRLGLGGASIGGLFEATDERAAIETIDRAWELGIRLVRHRSPLWLRDIGTTHGRALGPRPRDEYVLSTKVGRLIRPADRIPPGADVDRQAFDGRDDAFYVGTGNVRPVFDYSADGVKRSIEESLERLGLGRIDIALIHDPDDHWAAAIDEAYPALHDLREQGVIGAIGAGMNQSAMLARFVREGDLDVVMLAGRYTLLDQEGLDDLLPLCLERGVGVLAAGVDEQRHPGRSAARRTVQLRTGGAGRSSSVLAGSRPSAPGTRSRCGTRRSSSRSPIRR